MATYQWSTYGGRVAGGFTEAEIENLAANLLNDMFPIPRVQVEKRYDERGLLLPPRLPEDPTAG